MPLDPEAVKKIIRDPQFQQMNPSFQVDTLRRYLNESDEDYGGLDTAGQLHTASQIIDYHSPGFIEKVGGALPIVGPPIRAAYDPNAIRPWTRAAAGLLGADEAVKTPVGAAVAESLREVAEFAGLSAVGGPIAKYVAGPLVEKTAAGLLGKGIEAAAQGLPTAAKTLAAGGAREAVEHMAERAVVDGTIGALYGVADMAERGEFHPMQQLVVNPLFTGALGVGLSGLGYALNRFGPAQTQAIVRALQENPELNATIQQAKPIVKQYAKSAGIAEQDAGSVVSRALEGELLDRDEWQLMRGVLTSDRGLLKSEPGLRILQTQKDHLAPKLSERPPSAEPVPEYGEGPLVVRYEMPNGDSRMITEPSLSQRDKLLADHYDGRIHIMEANVEGKGAQDFIDDANDPRRLYEAFGKVYPRQIVEAYDTYRAANKPEVSFSAWSKEHPGVPRSEYEKQYPLMSFKEFKDQFGISEHESRMRFLAERDRVMRPPEPEAAPRGPAGGIEPGIPGLRRFTPGEAPTEEAPLAPRRINLMEGIQGDPVVAKLEEKLGPGYSNKLLDEQTAEALPPEINALIGQGGPGYTMTGELPRGAAPAIDPITGAPASSLGRPSPAIRPQRGEVKAEDAWVQDWLRERERPPTMPKEPGTPIAFTGRGSSGGTVVEDSGIVAHIVDQTGAAKLVAPTIDGGHTEIVRQMPGAPAETQAAIQQVERAAAKSRQRKKPGPQAELDTLLQIETGAMTKEQADRARQLILNMPDNLTGAQTPAQRLLYDKRLSELIERGKMDRDPTILQTGDSNICNR